jgi:hypothetical protein
MSSNRLPIRDPRTVARDIPGVLDILFPRLSGGLVASLNKKINSFARIEPISDNLIKKSKLQKAMLFEISMARAEFILKGDINPDWNSCIQIAEKRQKRHFDAKIPEKIDEHDIVVAGQGAQNLVDMLRELQAQYRGAQLDISPPIPGMGWIASGHGDFALGTFLIEVKYTDRNFVAADFRQVLMYWLLKYAASIEDNTELWTGVFLLNPRRNFILEINIDCLIRSASASSNRIELSELLRSIVCHDLDRQ